MCIETHKRLGTLTYPTIIVSESDIELLRLGIRDTPKGISGGYICSWGTAVTQE